MIDPTVRPAVDDDRDQVAWLEELARESLAGRRGGDRWLATHPPHGGSSLASRTVFVATLDEAIVGYLVVRLSDEVAVVDDVFVHPDAREVGFGDALLATALDHARTNGARVLEASALPGDRETKNLYERAGIKARLITVSTELRAPGGEGSAPAGPEPV